MMAVSTKQAPRLHLLASASALSLRTFCWQSSASSSSFFSSCRCFHCSRLQVKMIMTSGMVKNSQFQPGSLLLDHYYYQIIWSTLLKFRPFLIRLTWQGTYCVWEDQSEGRRGAGRTYISGSRKFSSSSFLCLPVWSGQWWPPWLALKLLLVFNGGIFFDLTMINQSLTSDN